MFRHSTVSFQVKEHLKDLGDRAVAAMNLHYREDLSCMHRKNCSTGKGVQSTYRY